MKSIPAAPEWFDVRPSRWMALCCGLLAALAVLAVMVLDLPLAVRLLASASVLGWAAWAVREQALRRGPRGVVAVGLGADNAVELRLREGAIRQCVLLGSSTVLGPLVVLRCRADGARRAVSLVLMPDALSADAARLLRVWLRWKTGWSAPDASRPDQ